MARRAVLTLLALAALAAYPAAASAGEFKRDRTGDAKVKGLKPAQRKALDIIGVDVTRTLFVAKVVVRFKGNFEKQMRTKALRKAGALIRLTPGQASAGAAGLLSPPAARAAATPTTIASIGSGKRLRTLSSRRGGGIAALRSGRELTFWVARVNAIQLKNVQARSFDGRPRPRRRARQASDASELRALLQKPVADQLGFLQSVLQAPRISTDCKRVRELMEQLQDSAQSLNGLLNSLASQEHHGEYQKALDAIEPLIAQASAYLAGPPCFEPATQDGGGGDGGSGTPSATSCPLTATAVNKPNPPSPNPLDTNVHGQCNGAWDYFDIEIKDGFHSIEGWIAHSNVPCEVYDQNGTKLTQNPDGSINLPAGSYIAKLRCFNKGDNLIDIDLDIAPNPSNNTPIDVTVHHRDMVAVPEQTLTR